MTPKQCRWKRNELLVKAREAEKTGGEFGRAVGSRCRILATNLSMMTSNNHDERLRGQVLYEKNRTDFERYMAERAAHREAGQ